MTPVDFLELADALPEAMLLLSGAGVILAANRQIALRLGLDPRELSGKPMADCLIDEPPAFASYLRSCSRSRDPLIGSVRLALPDGGELACRCKGSMVRPRTSDSEALVLLRLCRKQAAAGQFRALNEKIQELVDENQRRVEVEAELWKQQEWFRVALSTIGDAVIATDTAGHVRFLNSVAEGVTGWTCTEAEGQPLERVFLVVDEIESRPLENLIEAALRENTVQQRAQPVLLISRQGMRIPIVDCAAPICDQQAQAVGGVLVFHDIADRQRSERIAHFLADASAALSVLVDDKSYLEKLARLAVPFFADWCAVYEVGPNGTLQRLAAAHSNLVPAHLAERLQRDPAPLPAQPGMPPVLDAGAPETAATAPEPLLAELAYNAEQIHVLRSLGLKSYLCLPLSIRGRTVGAIAFATAESGRQYAPADLALAEDLAQRAAIAMENTFLYAELQDADRRKNEFLAMLGHELRNPLAPLRHALALLGTEGADAHTREQARQIMERQMEHLVRLVDDLLDLSRIMRGKIELRKAPVELASLIGRGVEAVQPLIDEKGHRLSISLPPGPIWLDGDAIRLTQVIGNILQNSAKYTEPAGHIWLTCEREAGSVAIHIRDDGVGMDASLLPRIFDLFTQADRAIDRSQGGLGIGLTLVRTLVEMHGGTVEVWSAGPGQGSEFVVRLPTLEVSDIQRLPAWKPNPVPPCRVLVVEDNVGSAKVLARTLSRFWGHEVELAHNGLEALEMASTFRPALVLLDIGLPGISGYEVAQRLRAQPQFQGTLLVALTGYGQAEDRRRSREAGIDEHLVKPASVEILQTLFTHPKLTPADKPS